MISSIFNENIQFSVELSGVGAVIALQAAVRVCVFVLAGVLKGPGVCPDAIGLRRWCVSAVQLYISFPSLVT